VLAYAAAQDADWGKVQSHFAVDPATGIVRVIKAFDRETMQSCVLSVMQPAGAFLRVVAALGYLIV